MTEVVGMVGQVSPSRTPSNLLSFLIADVRGYTRYTVEHGDEAAARLAGRFAELTEEVVKGHDGDVLELRGDEALVVFSSARNALRASVALQAAFQDAVAADPSLPLTVGMGLDAGEAIPVKGGYRGGALNLAARLCSIAGAGEVFCSQTVIGLARKTEGLAFLDRGQVQLKGLPDPVRVTQVVPEGAVPSEVPIFSVSHTPPSNLPIQPTPFIGRQREVSEIAGMLRRERVRLLTLSGPGGTGKTRLALQVAEDILSNFADGAFFVSLASLADSGPVASSIATALGVKEMGEQPLAETLSDYLRDKQLLLVLDNFEHVLPATSLVSELLLRCPRLNVLVTSRAALRLAAEHEHPVLPLALPDPKQLPDLDALSQYDAIALFVERAQAVKPGFAVTNENAPAVAEICSRLDGLPLAIELAAARIRLFPPHTLLQRLSSRLTLLTGGARDAPVRQQTLRNAIDWSYSLLAEGEQRLFARLSVFAGGFSYEAAEAVCNPDGELDLLEGLTSLVEKSLLRQEDAPTSAAEEPRFLPLETIREYAAEKLTASGEEQRLRQDHATFFTEMVEHGERKFWGPGQKEWMDQLEREHDNLRAVLGWSLRDGDPMFGLRLAVVIGIFWEDHGHLSEGRRWLEALLAGDAGAGTSQRAKAFDTAGMLARGQGDFQHAHLRLEESLRLYRELGDRQGAAMVLAHLGGLARLQDDLDWAVRLLEESISINRQIDDRHFLASALTNLGEVWMGQGNYGQARAMLDEALTLRRELGDTVATAPGRHVLSRGARPAQGCWLPAEDGRCHRRVSGSAYGPEGGGAGGSVVGRIGRHSGEDWAAYFACASARARRAAGVADCLERGARDGAGGERRLRLR
jgi:predicted ATPase/class 3 adenylate cyclase